MIKKTFIKKKNNKILIILLLIILLIISVFFFLLKIKQPIKVNYNEFNNMLNKGLIQDVTIDFESSKFTFTDTDKNSYVTDNPRVDNFKIMLLAENIDVHEKNKLIFSIVQSLIFPLLTLVFFYFIFKTMLKSTSISNKYKTKNMNSSVRFSNIAGYKEIKDDILFIVDFLKNPKKYLSMGAALPKGIIFYGPPGTGKTLIAKAIAGEADVPFYYISGSDFVELYVGVGARRVRELFAEAKKFTPCVIFIDEIDSIGNQRGKNSNSEQNQTINALLNELDGFDTEKGILVIAATNKLEQLDDALLRPGRFDRHIAIPLPDKEDRYNILKLHAQGKLFSADVDFDELSKITINFSGAGIKTLLNEAAIIAAKNNQKNITKTDVDMALFKILTNGNEKSNRSNRDFSETEVVAWHEAGHTLVTKLLTRRAISKVSIIPSTSGIGGFTLITPSKLLLHSKEDLEQDIMIRYGGRIAELILLGNEDKVTTGAQDDIKQATSIIMDMIKCYGMSRNFGLLNLSELMAEDNALILDEAKRISLFLYNKTHDLLKENLHLLKAIADKLIEEETINEATLNKIIAFSMTNNNKSKTKNVM